MDDKLPAKITSLENLYTYHNGTIASLGHYLFTLLLFFHVQ